MVSRKRGNGEGSVSRRKGGGWIGQYTIHSPKGPKRKSVYGKTRAEVSEKLTKAMAERDGGMVFDDEGLSVEEYLTRWLKDSVKGSVKQTTFENYSYIVNQHLIPVLGHTKLRSLNPVQVQGLYRSRQDSGLSARTVRLMHTTLHKALKQAVRWNLVPRNATEAATPPKLMKDARKEIHPLSEQQARALISAAAEDRLGALYVLAISAGLRQGELLGLRWKDINLASATLSVRQQLTRSREYGLSFTEPKTKKSRRSIRLTRGSVDALKRHRAVQNEEKLRLGSLWREQDLVFASVTGGPLDVGNLMNRSFHPLLKRAGISRIRFHDLRHTCATLLLTQNVNPKIVQEMLGHANISETMDTYSHVLPNMQESAVSAMENALA